MAMCGKVGCSKKGGGPFLRPVMNAHHPTNRPKGPISYRDHEGENLYRFCPSFSPLPQGNLGCPSDGGGLLWPPPNPLIASFPRRPGGTPGAIAGALPGDNLGGNPPRGGTATMNRGRFQGSHGGSDRRANTPTCKSPRRPGDTPGTNALGPPASTLGGPHGEPQVRLHSLPRPRTLKGDHHVPAFADPNDDPTSLSRKYCFQTRAAHTEIERLTQRCHWPH